MSRDRESAALAAFACTLGLVYLWRRLSTVKQQVASLAERVKQHETDIEWLTQRLEPPSPRRLGSLPAAPAASPTTAPIAAASAARAFRPPPR